MSHVLPLTVTIGLLLAGCGSSDDASTPPEPTSTIGVTASAGGQGGDAGEIVVTRDLPYVAVDGASELTVDVYAPPEGGPWPVLVAYHGGGGPNNDAVARLARSVAEAGAVVFAPEWPGLALNAESQAALISSSPCSLWFAAEHAADHGGDPSDISVFGISAGAAKAAAVTFYPPATHEGCLAEPATVEPRVAVLHEGSYGFHPGFDDVFRDDPELFATATVWHHLDVETTTEIHLLADEKTLLDPYYDATTYIDASTGSIENSLAIRGAEFVDDAIRLGLLDDDEMNIAEISVLLEDHMRAAGLDPTLTWLDAASHAISGQVIEYTIDAVIGG